MSSSSKVTLRSDDGKTFEVDAMVAARSQTIKHMIEDDCAFNVIPLPNVSGNILSMVIEYCKKHSESESEVAATAIDDDLKAWDASFLNVDMDTIFSLMLAANYLNVKSLLDLTCQNVADIIKGKTVDEIRSTFNIKNDFTPAEEAEIRMENEWAFV